MLTAITVAMLLGTASLAGAHPVTVDGAAAEWSGAVSPLTNGARVSRNAQHQGEYVWLDAAQDERTELGNASGLDLSEVRVTGDHQNLYLMARLSGAAVASGAGAPLLQWAIDMDPAMASGATAFAYGDTTAIGDGLAWDALLATRFASGAAPRVVDSHGADIAASAQASLSGNVIECAVPWSALGFPVPPFGPVRMSLGLFRSDAGDQADAIAGASRLADAVTDDGIPGTLHNTSSAVAAGVLNYAFDVTFDHDGEVIAPILITEIGDSRDRRSQWVELYNASRVPMSLAGFKLGDSPAPSTAGGMGVLPGITLAPGQAVVIAEDAARFQSVWGMLPGGECESAVASVPDLTPFAPWSATSSMDFRSQGDQVLLLDRSNTVIDVVPWGNASWGGVTPAPSSSGQSSVARSQVGGDTDDGSADFQVAGAPTPGAVSAGSTLGVPGSTPNALSSSLGPNPFRDATQLALALPIAGPVRVDVLDTTGRRVRTLVNDAAAAPGVLRLGWSGDDERGRKLPNGLYLVRVESAAGVRLMRASIVR